jgi:hypothetical protein
MKEIEVEIVGITPLLMNSPKSMIDEMTMSSVKKTTQKKDIKEEAEKLAYRDKNGMLYVPCEAIKGTIVNASAYKKIGKYTAKPIIAGGVMISPIQISLGKKDYEIDLRSVVVQRGQRIIKARPLIDNWKLNFTIIYDETMLVGDDIKPLLEEAGKRVGILDFRPHKNGSFGTFKITKWKEKSTSK